MRRGALQSEWYWVPIKGFMRFPLHGKRRWISGTIASACSISCHYSNTDHPLQGNNMNDSGDLLLNHKTIKSSTLRMICRQSSCRNAADESIADSPRAIAASYCAATDGMTTSGWPCSAASSTINRTSFRAMLTVNEAGSNGPSAPYANLAGKKLPGLNC